MPQVTAISLNPAMKIEKELLAVVPQTGTPGYWKTLAENADQWAKELCVCSFWEAAKRNLPNWSSEYRKRAKAGLLGRDSLPVFSGKSADGIKSKVLRWIARKDVAAIFPAASPPVPQINDLVRTRIDCLFLDGVEFLASKLEELGKSLQLGTERNRQGRLEGYFAQHIYFSQDVIYRILGQPFIVKITCEIQVATQLSTRIWDASHSVYEKWRGQEDEAADWQWDPKDPRFIGRQLGHMIHLADGLLVQLRDAVIQQK